MAEQEEEEDEAEGEEDEEDEEEEEEREEDDGGIREERTRKRRKNGKKEVKEDPVEGFSPVRFLAEVLKAIQDTGKVPEREKKGEIKNIEVKEVKRK
mmetsp:Transcript_3477/g.4280  ORF Transcript_3477/g.4280 Transcript_3477/m.4280 type:complete len:97 (+) Transcript_3477:269-559(+)